MKTALSIAGLLAFGHITASPLNADPLTYPGSSGPGKGRHIVLISVSPDGKIDPDAGTSLDHPEALDTADAIVMLIRFRKWPDAAMKHFDAAMKRGVPGIALRTSTHPFQFPKSSGFRDYNSFGKRVLGEKWVCHWGKHKLEATRGVIEDANSSDPLLNGVSDVFDNSAPAVKPGRVREIRREIEAKKDFFPVEDLLKQYPS